MQVQIRANCSGEKVSNECRTCFAANNDVNRGHYALRAVPKGIADTSLIPIMSNMFF